MNEEYQKQLEAVSKTMAGIEHKIAVISGKGGVGKTTVAVNLAHALAEKHTVGLLDADITGPNVPKMLGIEAGEIISDAKGMKPVDAAGIKVMSMAFLLDTPDVPVIWRGPMKMNAINQFLGDVEWGELDYLIIDLPPGTGDEALSIAQLIPDMDGAIIVTTPQDVSILDARKAINFTRQVGLPILGIIENMSGFSCPHCHKKINLFGVGGGEKAAQEMGVKFLGRIPIQPEIAESGDSGKPFIVKDSKTNAVESFNRIVKKIEGELENEGG